MSRYGVLASNSAQKVFGVCSRANVRTLNRPRSKARGPRADSNPVEGLLNRWGGNPRLQNHFVTKKGVRRSPGLGFLGGDDPAPVAVGNLFFRAAAGLHVVRRA